MLRRAMSLRHLRSYATLPPIDFQPVPIGTEPSSGLDIPVLYKGVISHLSGVQKWSQNPQQLLDLLKSRGDMEVEVEVGKVFTEAERHQMKLNTFLTRLLAKDKNVYLAQTSTLFFQVPEILQQLFDNDTLRWLNVARYQLPNAWLGPAGKLTPLHRDPTANVLMQVVGKKVVVLLPMTWPDSALYMNPGVKQNSSQIGALFPPEHDFEEDQLIRSYPRFVEMLQNEPPLICELEPGDVLTIPPRMMHVSCFQNEAFLVGISFFRVCVLVCPHR